MDERVSANSKSRVKATKRAAAREEFIESELDKDPAAEINAARAAAKNAQLVVGAVKVLQAVVPDWPRAERRKLANAIRLSGNGYTKNTSA